MTRTIEDKAHQLAESECIANQGGLVNAVLATNAIQGMTWDELENAQKPAAQVAQDTGWELYQAEIDGEWRAKNYTTDIGLEDADDEDEAWEELCRQEDIEDEPQDILEWWLVTKRLADDLEEIGAPVLRTEYGDWWGRTTSGQHPGLDGEIMDVARLLTHRTGIL